MRSASFVPLPCSFVPCGRGARAKGLCKGHYDQRARGRDLKPIVRFWTKERIGQLFALHHGGVRMDVIASRMGITLRTALCAAERFRFKRPRLATKWTASRCATLRGFFDAELSYREIGAKMGITHRAARDHATRMGLKRGRGFRKFKYMTAERCGCGLLKPCAACPTATMYATTRRTELQTAGML